MVFQNDSNDEFNCFIFISTSCQRFAFLTVNISVAGRTELGFTLINKNHTRVQCLQSYECVWLFELMCCDDHSRTICLSFFVCSCFIQQCIITYCYSPLNQRVGICWFDERKLSSTSICISHTHLYTQIYGLNQAFLELNHSIKPNEIWNFSEFKPISSNLKEQNSTLCCEKSESAHRHIQQQYL